MLKGCLLHSTTVSSQIYAACLRTPSQACASLTLLRRAGAAQVYAIECLGHLADTAQRVACINGFGASLKVVHKDARYASAADAPGPGPALTPPDLPSRAQLAVFELFDCGCIGEGVLHVLAAVKAQLLVDGAAVVPARARMYCQPGQLRRLGQTHGLDVALLNQYHWGPDYVEVDLRGARVRGEWAPVSEPQPLFEFDFSGSAEQLREAFQPAGKELCFVVGSSGGGDSCSGGRGRGGGGCGSGGGSRAAGQQTLAPPAAEAEAGRCATATQQAAAGQPPGQVDGGQPPAQAEGCSTACPVTVVNCMAFWFDLDLGEGITLSSSPYCPANGSTWQQAVQYVQEVALQSGAVLAVKGRHDT